MKDVSESEGFSESKREERERGAGAGKHYDVVKIFEEEIERGKRLGEEEEHILFSLSRSLLLLFLFFFFFFFCLFATLPAGERRASPD